MLGYRSLFNVNDVERDVTSEVRAQIYAWLRGKGYEADRLAADGEVALIGPGVESVRTTEEGRDGSLSTLFTLREVHESNGTWITQVITHVAGHERGRTWVWIDVEQEGVNEGWAARPRVARDVLEVLPGDDCGALLTSAPTLVQGDEVDALIDVLTNQERRGAVFVAGTSDELPIQRWSAYIKSLLRETVGLAAGYVLDGDATARLTERVGARHAVEPGTLRTYWPGLDPDDELDAFRHRYLTTEAIIKSPVGKIAHALGRRARDLALTTPVPRWASRVESRLLAATDARVLGWRSTALVEQDPEPVVIERKHLSADGSTVPAVEPVHTGPPALPPHPELEPERSVAPVEDLAALARELFSVELGSDLLQQLAAERAESIAAEAQQISLESALARTASRAKKLNDRVLELEDQLELVRGESEDMQIEWAQAESLVEEHLRTINSLRVRLMEVGEHTGAWEPIEEPTGRELAPESFADLLARIDEFDYVAFTGDSGPSYALDEKIPMGAAAKAWSALRALNDYARGKKEGEIEGGVHQYLLQTPTGYDGFSANGHAQTESEDVQTNPKFFNARVLPVPDRVDQKCVTFMGAHFKITRFGMTSPRLHYYDATGVDGRIYVGYIGPHLPTQRTN